MSLSAHQWQVSVMLIWCGFQSSSEAQNCIQSLCTETSRHFWSVIIDMVSKTTIVQICEVIIYRFCLMYMPTLNHVCREVQDHWWWLQETNMFDDSLLCWHITPQTEAKCVCCTFALMLIFALILASQKINSHKIYNISNHCLHNKLYLLCKQ